MHFSEHFLPMNNPAVTARRLATIWPIDPPTIRENIGYFAARPIAEIYDLSPISATNMVKNIMLMLFKLTGISFHI